jgi:hypothetical protein
MVETMKEDSLTLWAEMHWGIIMDEAGDVEAVRALRVFFESLIPRQEKVLGLDHQDVKEVKARLVRGRMAEIPKIFFQMFNSL